MKTPSCLKMALFILSLAVVISVGASKNVPSCKKWIQPFQNEKSGASPTTRFIQNKLRSATSLKQRLDSMVSFVNDTLGLTGIDSKIQFEYNSFGQLTYQCMSSTSNETNILEPEESLVFVYDSKGMMTSDSSYSWDSDKKQLIRGGYNDYVYDIKGNLLEQIEAFVNFSTIFSKTTYAYDETGKQLNQTRYLMDDQNQWLYEDKTDYSYLSNGLLASTTECSWETYDNSWLFQAKTESNYDDQGRDTLTVSYRWNDSTDKWMDVEKVENTYDATGCKTKEVNYELVNGTSPWTKDSKVEYTFDSKGNLLSEVDYSWDEDSLSWTGNISTHYEYDLNVGTDDLIMPFQLNNFPIYSKLTGGAFSIWVDLLQDWLPIANVSCYYSSMEVMSLPKAVSTKSSWSFNSNSNVLNLDAANVPSSLQLFDLQGREVASFRNLSSTSFSLNHLKRGLYLIVLELKGGKERGKLVVE